MLKEDDYYLKKCKEIFGEKASDKIITMAIDSFKNLDTEIAKAGVSLSEEVKSINNLYQENTELYNLILEPYIYMHNMAIKILTSQHHILIEFLKEFEEIKDGQNNNKTYSHTSKSDDGYYFKRIKEIFKDKAPKAFSVDDMLKKNIDFLDDSIKQRALFSSHNSDELAELIQRYDQNVIASTEENIRGYVTNINNAFKADKLDFEPN